MDSLRASRNGSVRLEFAGLHCRGRGMGGGRGCQPRGGSSIVYLRESHRMWVQLPPDSLGANQTGWAFKGTTEEQPPFLGYNLGLRCEFPCGNPPTIISGFLYRWVAVCMRPSSEGITADHPCRILTSNLPSCRYYSKSGGSHPPVKIKDEVSEARYEYLCQHPFRSSTFVNKTETFGDLRELPKETR